ncbi:MAG: hypothetical protein H7Y33_05430 [Cytophagales bacterium]|nr:hypothetical protein [Rhizobacter sp.]
MFTQHDRGTKPRQRGQYSTQGVSGGMAYKCRFTDAARGIDSFAVLDLPGNAAPGKLGNDGPYLKP